MPTVGLKINDVELNKILSAVDEYTNSVPDTILDRIQAEEAEVSRSDLSVGELGYFFFLNDDNGRLQIHPVIFVYQNLMGNLSHINFAIINNEIDYEIQEIKWFGVKNLRWFPRRHVRSINSWILFSIKYIIYFWNKLISLFLENDTDVINENNNFLFNTDFRACFISHNRLKLLHEISQGNGIWLYHDYISFTFERRSHHRHYKYSTIRFDVKIDQDDNPNENEISGIAEGAGMDFEGEGGPTFAMAVPCPPVWYTEISFYRQIAAAAQVNEERLAGLNVNIQSNWVTATTDFFKLYDMFPSKKGIWKI